MLWAATQPSLVARVLRATERHRNDVVSLKVARASTLGAARTGQGTSTLSRMGRPVPTFPRGETVGRAPATVHGGIRAAWDGARHRRCHRHKRGAQTVTERFASPDGVTTVTVVPSERVGELDDVEVDRTNSPSTSS